MSIEKYEKFYVWAAVPPEQRVSSSSSVMKVDVHLACAASLKLI